MLTATDMRRDELLRQADRLRTDFISRELGIALACALFALRLPMGLILVSYTLIVLTEYIDVVVYRSIERKLTSWNYAAIILNSFFAFLLFSLLGTLVWFTGDPLAQVAGVLSLVGALINVSTARATHLPLGIVCGLPPAAALFIISSSGWNAAPGFGTSAMALVATVGLLGYFGSALYQNHIVQRRLAQALDRARAASEAKSRFLSGMNHEIRTPLNAILGLSQTLGATAAARGIEQGARSLQMLVENVLDLAEAEERGLLARSATAQIARTAGQIRDAILADGSARTVSLEKPSDDLPEFARFDAALLRKTVQLSAARFLPPDANATLSARRDAQGRLALRLGWPVADRPVGVDTTAQSARALADELRERQMAALGATFDCTGTDGAQNCLSITLPVEWLPALPDPAEVAARRPLRVMIVDDVSTNRFVLSRILSSLGITPIEAEGGPAALSLIARGSVDLVLLDLNMPGMSGEETLMSIRTSGRAWSAVPVLALTADALTERRNQSLDLGFDGFVTKPVDQRLLWAEIVSALRL